MSGRYGKASGFDKQGRETEDQPIGDTVLVEQRITEVRAEGAGPPGQEKQLRDKGLAVCFIKGASGQALDIYVNGVLYKCPTQTWIRVPVSVKDVLENAGLL